MHLVFVLSPSRTLCHSSRRCNLPSGNLSMTEFQLSYTEAVPSEILPKTLNPLLRLS